MRSNMIPATGTRVERQTAAQHNLRIRRQTEQSVARHYAKSHYEITRRLRDLDYEWDIERMLEINAASVSLIGLIAGALWHRRAFVVPAVVAGFLLQHALHGWCPPLPLFRRLGFRTAREIYIERIALKFLRGDFKDFCQEDVGNAGPLMAAASK